MLVIEEKEDTAMGSLDLETLHIIIFILKTKIKQETMQVILLFMDLIILTNLT